MLRAAVFLLLSFTFTSLLAFPTGVRLCRRDKRFVLAKTKWPNTRLTWQFRDPFGMFHNETQRAAARQVIARALETWEKDSGRTLQFKETFGRDKVDLEVLFAKYHHNDLEDFDGEGGIIAHSAYPTEGLVHFDASEHWSTDGREGLDLRYVALHEIGHALGLRHSTHPKAIMNPYYREQLSDGFRLSKDDIFGIKELYDNTEY
ncbi:hypothetical protein QR680_012259 [Steinernema hermaphroditum]|uniref:Peptidase metallopeptidase domain-containing protein n=1 Tax=Steinernema hermaphroditum TaxID=289476 RepID=A0AA39I1G9_9BILA|nr:hypothetical protein QR680_012259 [Steinernema hermaphroditum]